jgi:hypothetical protein
VPYPWDATVDLSSPYPARFYASLIAQTLQYGAPAARRFGAAWALAARVGIPEGVAATALRSAGSLLRQVPALTTEKESVSEAWRELRATDPTLPAECPPLAVLQLATTTFFFGASRTPLLVAKTSRTDCTSIENEVAALRTAAQSGFAPRYLGCVDGAEMQRGLSGRALNVVPIRARTAAALPWTPQHASLAAGLATIARVTARDETPTAMSDGVVDDALTHPGLSEATRRAVAAAADAVRVVPVSVLRHTDTSPQNILFEGDRLTGLVDWADATSRGMPGADAWNAALACIDKGVGLTRYTEPHLLLAFKQAWFHSEFGAEARLAGARAAEAAGFPAALHGALEQVFFARRLGHRMRYPDRFPTSADVSARMLSQVVARPL